MSKNVSFRRKIFIHFFIVALLPVILLSSFYGYFTLSSQDSSNKTCTNALLDLSGREIEKATEIYSKDINGYFTSVENQLNIFTEYFVRCWNNEEFLIDADIDYGPVINNRYFYGELNGTVNGTVMNYNTGDYIDYNDDGINDFEDFGADFLGDISEKLEVNGSVDLCVNSSYSSSSLSQDAFVEIQVRLVNSTKIRLDIRDFFIANDNSWSTTLFDDWSPSNSDQLVGTLSNLDVQLKALDAKSNISSLDTYFFLYDGSPNHRGVIRPDGSSKRIEGVIEGQINGTFDGIIRGNLTLSLNGTANERLTQLEPVFSQIYKQNQPTFSWVYLGSSQRGFLYQYPWNPNYANDTLIYVGPGYDCKKRAWYNSTMAQENEVINETPSFKGQNSFWTNLVVDWNTRKVSINIGRVIYDDKGNLVGPLEFKLVVEEIQQKILNISFGKSGYAFLIDSQGKIVASPDYLKLKYAIPLSGADDFASRDLLNTGDPELTSIIRTMIAGDSGTANVIFNEHEVIISYYPIPTTNWSLGIVVSKNEIIQPINELKTSLTTTLTVLIVVTIVLFLTTAVVVIFLSIRLALNITEPITNLTGITDEISRGNFKIKLDLNEFTLIETNKLAMSFNRMAKSLFYVLKEREATLQDDDYL